MRLVSEKKFVNRKEVENLLDISQASAARILRKMVDENKIKRSAAERMCHTSNETLKVEIIS